MSFIKTWKDNKQHKKCVQLYERIKHTLEYSTSHSCIVPISGSEGYDELLEWLRGKGWIYEFLGNKKEGFSLSVKSKECGKEHF